MCRFARFRAPVSLAAVLLVAFAFAFGAGAQTGAGEIRVEGNQRIEAATVRQYMGLDPGRAPTGADLDRALKALFDSGLFADVVVERDGSDVVVRVVENPIINRIAFEGNRRISDEDLQGEVELRPRVVFTRSRVQRDVQRIVDVYRRSGRFTARVEPKVILLPQNRLDLVFEISEGELTEIRSIAFIGNEAFDDGDLREVIQTKESAWYRVLSAGDTYDPDRLTFDRELLRRHYLSEGYADFRVIAAVGELTPEKDAFLVTFALSEGERYRFGEIDVETSLEEVDGEALEDVVTVRSGDWYDAEEIDASIDELTDALGDLGYAHVEVEPRVRRDRGNRSVAVRFAVSESPRVIVERIEISGNVRTEDRVIRREILLAEGDLFSTSRLRRSRQRIVDLGFFDKVDMTNERGSAPDRTVVRIAVRERSTGELSIGVGYTTDGGVVTDLGVRERNLLGRGQELGLSVEIGSDTERATLSFTEPYFLEMPLSAGFDLYRSSQDLQDESSYDLDKTGVALRVGYRLAERLSQRWTYRLEEADIGSIGVNASRAVQGEEGTTLISSLGQTLLYDLRDSRIEPTEGYSARLRNVGAGFGGDRRYLRNELKMDYYRPLTEKWIFGAEIEGGHLYDFGKPTRLSERYFLGGSSLRGFKPRGVGPRDGEDALGGDWFYRGTVQVIFPVGLPSELGVSGRVYTDFGTVGGIDSVSDILGDGSLLHESSLRAAAGFGLSLSTPLGPLTLSWSRAVAKEEFDKTESFRFGVGARF